MLKEFKFKPEFFATRSKVMGKKRVRQCNTCGFQYHHSITYNGCPKCPQCYNPESFILVERIM